MNVVNLNENKELKSSNNTEKEKSKEIEVYNGILKGLKVHIEDEKSKKLYEKGYYGNFENNILILEPLEALLLLERKRLNIYDENDKNYNFRALSEYFVKNIPNFWTKYLVYKDIRSRGYIIRQGFGESIEFRVYDRGVIAGESAAKYLLHPITEGTPLKLVDLAKITKIAKSSRKKLVLTVVDRQGEVTYYQCKEVLL